jgi:hypothetical protein
MVLKGWKSWVQPQVNCAKSRAIVDPAQRAVSQHSCFSLFRQTYFIAASRV